MSAETASELDSIAGVPQSERASRLIALGERVLDDGANGEIRNRLARSVLDVVTGGSGTARERLRIGELLGYLGDPRLTDPSANAYWIEVPAEDGLVRIARFPVTNAEYRRYIESGGYEDLSHWSDAGREWLAACPDPWPVRAEAESSEPFVIPNQPVVGVTWYEAEAYARKWGARLPRFDERLWVVRGFERRPYPWGSPFGAGNANTREEVLGRPVAVGLYLRDRTPEGVCDLAGNAAEWTEDGVGEHKWIHPGSWDQPSMASWAKARSLESPTSRWGGLGFRLGRDA